MTPRGRKPYGPRTDVPLRDSRPRPLRDMRIACGLTQAEAAEACRVSLPTWRRWERGLVEPPRWWEELFGLNYESIKAKRGASRGESTES